MDNDAGRNLAEQQAIAVLPHRKRLRLLINASRWDTIGKAFGFTPRFVDFHGVRTFDWTSCNAAFWKVLHPEPKPDPACRKWFNYFDNSKEFHGKLICRVRAFTIDEADAECRRRTGVNPCQPTVGCCIDNTKPPPATRVKKARRPLSIPAGISLQTKEQRKTVRRKAGKGRRIYDDETFDFISRLVWLKTRGRCFYCKKRVFHEIPMAFPNRMVRDHYIPMVRGGLDDHSNLVPACDGCDNKKGGRLPEDFCRPPHR